MLLHVSSQCLSLTGRLCSCLQHMTVRCVTPTGSAGRHYTMHSHPICLCREPFACLHPMRPGPMCHKQPAGNGARSHPSPLTAAAQHCYHCNHEPAVPPRLHVCRLGNAGPSWPMDSSALLHLPGLCLTGQRPVLAQMPGLGQHWQHWRVQPRCWHCLAARLAVSWTVGWAAEPADQVKVVES